MTDITYQNFTDCSYVSVLGFVGICDIKPELKTFLLYQHNAPGFVSYENIVIEKDETIVFLKPDYVCLFAEFFLDKLKHKISLVSTSSDYIIPLDVPNTKSWRKISESDKIIKWYTTNCGLNFSKLVPIPIGLPYNLKKDPCMQEKEFEDVKKTLRPLRETNYKAVTNFQHQMEYLDDKFKKIKLTTRKQVYEILKEKQYITFLPKQDCVDFWKSCDETMFVISPFGNGPDCHRTWEALCLGRVPIIQKFPMNSMFENLPVVIVNDWNEVTEDFLKKQYNMILENYKKGIYSFEKLKLSYWQSKIRNME